MCIYNSATRCWKFTWKPQLPWGLLLEALSLGSRFHLLLTLNYIPASLCSLGHHHTLQSGVPETLAHTSYTIRPKDPNPTRGETWEGHRNDGGRDPHSVSEKKYKSIKGFHGGLWCLSLASGHSVRAYFWCQNFHLLGLKHCFMLNEKLFSPVPLNDYVLLSQCEGVCMGFQVCRWQEGEGSQRKRTK